MTRPSPHITWAELACKDGTPYPEAFIADGTLDRLVALFEQVRQLMGGHPLAVLSAYRTPTHNRRIGGAPDSQHLHGRALDLRPPASMTPGQMVARLKQAKAAGALVLLGGIGLYQGFVHIDTRPLPPGRLLVAWNGGTQRKDDRA